MSDRAQAALFVAFVWWLSTGVVLRLVWLGRSNARLVVASALALLALFGIRWSSQADSVAGAYIGFTSALVVWGWHELVFLLGIVTGPRKAPNPPGATGWRRFRYATATLIHHELALVLTLAVVVALTWRAPSLVGMWTFAVLWVMRLSAKLNVFLGVRNLSTHFVPPNLRHLLTYFRTARMNPLMPVSVLLGVLVVVRIAAQSETASAPASVGHTLVATLLALAVLEHLFLSIPVPDALLWKWAMRKSPSNEKIEPSPQLGKGVA